MAQMRIRERLKPGAVEAVTLADAVGRRLAHSVKASHSVPHFRRSGLDGFALRAGETAGASQEQPVVFEVVETIPCGSVPQRRLEPGQAARIMTGAQVPDEADAVIMFELTDSFERGGMTYVSVKKEMKPGANISPIALEMQEGELLLEEGRLIGAGESALLAMFGHPTVEVYKRPRVAIFATGSELLRVEEELQPGRIRNSNGYMLAAQVAEAGGLPVIMETVPDEVEAARKVILAAFDEYDAVITTGGVSVGDYDILYDLTQDWDGELLFNKLAMRPGSPTTVGVWKEKFLFALSGNPGACFVGFELFTRPVLLGLQGVQNPLPPEHSAIMAVDYAKGDKYQRFLRGVRYVEEGRILAKPVGIDASSVTVSIRDSDCLIIVPLGEGGLRAGETVRVIPLGPLPAERGREAL